MLLDSRKRYIVEALLESDGVLKEHELAEKLDVSIRTIRNDINYLKSYLEKSNIFIKSKPRIGVWVEADENNKKALWDKLDVQNGNAEVAFEQQSRCRYIIKKLLNSDRNITMQELADELFISKATVNLDMKLVEEWIKKHNLGLHKKTYHGIKVVGNEKDFRFAIASYIRENTNKSINIDSINQMFQNTLMPDVEGLKDILTHVGEMELIYVNKIIYDIQRENNISLTDDSYWELTIYFLIMVDRIRKGKHVRFLNADAVRIMKTREYSMALTVADKIMKLLHLNINQDEICYITMHLLGIKVNVYSVSDDETVNFRFNEEIEVVINRLIKYIKDRFNLDLTMDKKLILGLSLHFVSAINRLKYGTSIHNPMIDEIKRNYPYAFNIAVEISNILKDSFQIDIIEDEIGFIALHLQAAIERNEEIKNQRIRTYVVCNSGIGVAQLLSIQLKKNFPQIEISKIVSISDLISEIKTTEYKGKIQLVISTIPIKEIDVPIIHVNPVISPQDIKNIEREITRLTKLREYKNRLKRFLSLRAYTREDLIFLEMNFKNKIELVEFVSSKLFDAGFVTREFAESVLEREKLSTTYIGNGAAMPHGYSQYVNKPIISIVQLKEPIDWEGKKVNIVFLCAMDLSLNKDAEKLFEDIYEIVNNKEYLKKLKQISNKAEFMEILGWA
ncbi:BglG family transcription antiterminator [Fonticella tunisiensis]|uniref:BglG family transcription antiterminator n=1 Tax=Fonticella tunisiensis TaxID=1096341 RepID=UPI001A9B71A6|nr:BglG family transcription antiterminator [Fonticella tunisiensis]